MFKPSGRDAAASQRLRARSTGSGLATPKPADKAMESRFDESLAWQLPFRCRHDEDFVFEFTQGAMNHNDFIDILVARSPTDDALVDVMFALLVHFVFESAKRELSSAIIALMSHYVISSRLQTGLVNDFRLEFERVKYSRHLFDLFARMKTSLLFKAQQAYAKRQSRAKEDPSPAQFELKLPAARAPGRNKPGPIPARPIPGARPAQGPRLDGFLGEIAMFDAGLRELRGRSRRR